MDFLLQRSVAYLSWCSGRLVKCVAIGTLFYSQFSSAQNAFSVHVTVNAGYRISAEHDFQAQFTSVPWCADGYLGGGHRGKHYFTDIEVVKGNSIWTLQGVFPIEYPEVTWGCDPKYVRSFVVVHAEGVPDCHQQDPENPNLPNCVHPHYLQFAPDNLNGQKLDLNCEVTISKLPEGSDFRKVSCPAN